MQTRVPIAAATASIEPVSPPISAQVRTIGFQHHTISSGRGCDEFVVEQLEGLRHFCSAHHLNFLALLRRAMRAYWKSLRREGQHEGNAPDAEVHLDPQDFEDASIKLDGSERLAWLRINETNFHVLAIGVQPRGPGETHRALNKRRQATIDRFLRAGGAEGVFHTNGIQGAPFLLFINPYCHEK